MTARASGWRVLAGEIGQVRDMLAAVTGHDGTPKYHRTVREAVQAAQAGAAGALVSGKHPRGRRDG